MVRLTGVDYQYYALNDILYSGISDEITAILSLGINKAN